MAKPFILLLCLTAFGMLGCTATETTATDEESVNNPDNEEESEEPKDDETNSDETEVPEGSPSESEPTESDAGSTDTTDVESTLFLILQTAKGELFMPVIKEKDMCMFFNCRLSQALHQHRQLM